MASKRFRRRVHRADQRTLSIQPKVQRPGLPRVDYDTAEEQYREQCAALIEIGVDFLLVEDLLRYTERQGGRYGGERRRRRRPAALYRAVITITDMSGGPSLASTRLRRFWYSLRRPHHPASTAHSGADKAAAYLSELSRSRTTLILAYCAGLSWVNDGTTGADRQKADQGVRRGGGWFQHGRRLLRAAPASAPIAKALEGREASPVPTTVITGLPGLEPMHGTAPEAKETMNQQSTATFVNVRQAHQRHQLRRVQEAHRRATMPRPWSRSAAGSRTALNHRRQHGRRPAR